MDEQSHMRKGWDLTRSEATATAGVAAFARRVVTTIKPRLAVENRADTGFTVALAQGLKDNGFGRLIVCDQNAEKCARLKKEIADLGLSPSISLEIRNQSALETKFEGAIDLLVCSADHEEVVRRLLGQINPFGVVLLHANESEYKAMREFVLSMEKEGLISVVALPESLRLRMAQKRSGRK